MGKRRSDGVVFKEAGVVLRLGVLMELLVFGFVVVGDRISKGGRGAM